VIFEFRSDAGGVWPGSEACGGPRGQNTVRLHLGGLLVCFAPGRRGGGRRAAVRGLCVKWSQWLEVYFRRATMWLTDRE